MLTPLIVAVYNHGRHKGDKMVEDKDVNPYFEKPARPRAKVGGWSNAGELEAAFTAIIKGS